jgi:two-component system phosphate regulon sensor histidine kinase PhoR
LKHNYNINKVPYLFGVVCLALLSLVAFQIIWLSNSRDLIEEQFDQKVNLAIGSALSDFNTNHKTELNLDDLQNCGDGDVYKYLPVEKEFMSVTNQLELKESLKSYMSLYGIDEKYEVDILRNSCMANKDAYCCSINAGTSAMLKKDYYLGVSFVTKKDYLYDKMKFMILSSILIFLLLTTVSFVILRALIKQKRITENNIDFFNNTAHELKTPLTNISLALNLLGRKHEHIKDDKYANIIKGESAKLSSQIERVLFLSRMESGEQQLKKDAICIKKLLQDVVENMQMLVKEQHGTIELNLPARDIAVVGDAYHLSNVFRNLIDNALKYSSVQPKITITLTEDAAHAKVIFSDNGIGISKDDQQHIFEKFQRVNTGDVREAKGFGIGLSYVKTVIEMHKGLINVQSELNKGSQFELVIPNG